MGLKTYDTLQSKGNDKPQYILCYGREDSYKSLTGERTKISGIVAEESLNTSPSSAVWGSMNLWPK